MPLPPFLTIRGDGAYLAIKVQPRASRNEICQVMGGELKVKISAPPVDSAANEALVDFLAGTLGCPRGCVKLVRGHTSRHKQFLIQGVTSEAIAAKLGA